MITIQFDNEMAFSVQDLLNNNIQEIMDDIAEISEISTKERGFEKILLKMRNDWKNVNFEVI